MTITCSCNLCSNLQETHQKVLRLCCTNAESRAAMFTATRAATSTFSPKRNFERIDVCPRFYMYAIYATHCFFKILCRFNAKKIYVYPWPKMCEETDSHFIYIILVNYSNFFV